jgi:hypothetical protein
LDYFLEVIISLFFNYHYLTDKMSKARLFSSFIFNILFSLFVFCSSDKHCILIATFSGIRE